MVMLLSCQLAGTALLRSAGLAYLASQRFRIQYKEANSDALARVRARALRARAFARVRFRVRCRVLSPKHETLNHMYTSCASRGENDLCEPECKIVIGP